MSLLDKSSLLDQRWERALRSLLWRLRPAGLQAHVAAAMADIEREASGSSADDTDPDAAAEAVYQRMRQSVVEQLLLKRFGPTDRDWTRSRLGRREQFVRLLDRSIPALPAAEDPDFHCDSGLGGLARWLRAMGYDARFWPGINDQELVAAVVGTTAILLTTDSRLMRHGAIAHGAIAALLVPVAKTKRDQLEFVATALELPRLPPRCMACGGELVAVEKESVRERIPPRTYPWRDEYFVCAACHRLFWEGSHWEKIRSHLAGLAAAPRGEGAGSR